MSDLILEPPLSAPRGHGISLLVPFFTDHGRRERTWQWLRRYWESELPGAEIVIGHNEDVPYCKTKAVNEAARRATGDVFVIMDADCYLPGEVIQQCAAAIRRVRSRGGTLWYMPYRQFWRITEPASRMLMAAGPDSAKVWFFASAPPSSMVEDTSGSGAGHWYGALIQVMPREAFELTGGMDERFSGWGGEDISFMHAVDTLYGKHKSTSNGVLHFWHARLGESVHSRTWEGQAPGSNSSLASRYHMATGDQARMLALAREWQEAAGGGGADRAD